MELISKDVVALVAYLVPGFVAGWVFYGLTEHPRRTPFERIVQALIFTVLIQVIVAGIRAYLLSFPPHQTYGPWDKNVELGWSLVVAGLMGLIFTIFAEHDWLHWVLRKLKITARTSYASEWISTFRRDDNYAELTLVDKTKLFAWIVEYPYHPKRGHFVLCDVHKVRDDGTHEADEQIFRLRSVA